jgi:hypothetical protein
MKKTKQNKRMWERFCGRKMKEVPFYARHQWLISIILATQ